METLVKDIRYALRTLAKRPGFTSVVVITIALGIGANTAIFSVVNGVMLRPLPYPEPDRLVALREANISQLSDSQVAPGNFLEWQRQNTVFSDLAAYRTVSYNLTGSGSPERLLAGRVSTRLFRTLRVQPILGRDFLPEEDRPGNEKVVLISHGLWQRRFGADNNVIGKTLTLGGENFTVIGVMPAEFRLPDQRDREIWTPIAFKETEQTLYQARYLESIARLKPGVTLDQTRAEMAAVAGRLAQQFPDADTGWSVRVVPLLDFVVGDFRSILWLLFGAVGLVLLIACANVTNLLLARAVTRQKEMAIRAALGAGRWRIARQLTTESVLLALLGGMVAWPLAVWGLKGLLALAPPDLPRIAAVTLDSRALLFMLGITLLTGLIFGLRPAWQLARLDPNSTLKHAGGEGDRGVRQHRIGNLLVTIEVALSLLLLIGGGLLLRTVWQLRRVDPGFDYHNALAVTVQLPDKRYSDPAHIARFGQQLVQDVATLPGVESAGVARILPIVHELQTGLYFEGTLREPDNQLPQTNYSAVSPGYFKAMGIPLIAGRGFTDRDTLASPRVAIISEALAKRFFPNDDPLGKRINVTTGAEAFREIVGVAGDVKQNGLTRETLPHTYEPFAQAPDQFITLIVRTSSEPTALVPLVRDSVLRLDNELPLQRVTTLENIVANSMKQRQVTALLLSSFAVVSLLLVLAGLYGALSYSVSQRTRELGIRLALGAQVTDVLTLVLKEGMSVVLLGEALGLAGAIALTRLMKGLLFGVTATDAGTFIAVTGLLTVVGLIACYIPARRVTRVDPLLALKCE